MTMGLQQLDEEYEQLRDLLALYPNITILGTEGQPPEHYEIEYHLPGYRKDADGTIGITETHRIRISLPFGYPHFAPIAKPLTPLFHPDVDPAAIRIADHWQQNPSLPNLVLLIGEMISGHVYNLENPFNQAAADWYKANAMQLPLCSPAIAAGAGNTETEIKAPVDEALAPVDLEKKVLLKPDPSVDPSEITRIHDLVAHHKIFTANALLAELPETTHFPDRDDIQQKIGKVLRKIDQHFRLIEQLEDVGKFGEALEILDNIIAIAADAPEVEVLRTRIQQSYQLMQSSGLSSEKADRAAQKPHHCKKSPPPPSPPETQVKLTRMAKVIPWKTAPTAILLLMLCIGVFLLYINDQRVIGQARDSLRDGQLLIEKQQVDEGLDMLEAAKAALGELTILRFRKESLEEKINVLITANEAQQSIKRWQGLQGRNIPAGTTANTTQDLRILTDKAEALAGEGKTDKALTLYKQALELAIERKLVREQGILKESVQNLELQSTLAMAERAEQEKNWSKAIVAYRKALALSADMNHLGTEGNITHRLTAANFRHELDLSKKAFDQSQWQETIKFLEQAQLAMNANPHLVTEQERQDIRRLLVNSRLYLMLSTAREAYQQKNWDQAVNEYQNALNLLAREPDSAGSIQGESQGKIEKTLLMVKIAQIQDKVLAAESEGDFTSILKLSKEMQQLIRSSNAAGDPAVRAVLQKVNDTIGKQQELLFQQEKKAWLEAHYEEIFRANYPTFQDSKLITPKAVFQKKIDTKFIYTLTCVERSQGSSSKLELSYMFDQRTEKWSTYNE